MNEKQALDFIIKKSRVHFYKPIQIAEILYRNRTAGLSLDSVENYRTVSKKWRDEVSKRVVGKASSSSSRYQDNIFDDNAMPPSLLEKLGELNMASGGMVEAYVYLNLIDKMNDLGEIHDYLTQATAEGFDLQTLLDLFTQNAGLRRSMDKVYEIITYALFDTALEALDINVHVEVKAKDTNLTQDFSDFTEKIINDTTKTARARVFRVGATNANDGGLDLWANFGPAIQVKHFAITTKHLEKIAHSVQADRLIIVGTGADKQALQAAIEQDESYSKVQSIVTLDDLSKWYKTSLSPKYRDSIGVRLLAILLREFEYEFPANQELPAFISERGYDQIALPDAWNLAKQEVS